MSFNRLHFDWRCALTIMAAAWTHSLSGAPRAMKMRAVPSP